LGSRGKLVVIVRGHNRYRRGANLFAAACASLRRRCVRLAAETSGAAALEFALVALPFLLLVLLTLQTLIIFWFTQALQTATNQAARLVLTGQITAYPTAADFKGAVCAELPPMFNCNLVYVDLQSALTFTNLNTAPPVPTYDRSGNRTDPPHYSVGQPGDVGILRVSYNWPVLGGVFGFADQPNGTRLITGTAVFQDEPYGSGLES
jgi:Flp pilus assembly protein TadG